MTRLELKNIMVRGHELAKEMEGDYMARISAGLKMAWAEYREKKEEKVMLNLNHQPSGGREWVAEITGTHPKYKLNRDFLRPVARDWSYSGKTGTTSFILEIGKIYEVNEPWGDRYFAKIENGEVVRMEAEEVLAQVA